MKTPISLILIPFLTLTPAGYASKRDVSSYDSISTGGFYTFGFEKNAFSPDNVDETWWVVDENNSLEEIHSDGRKRSQAHTDVSHPRYRVFFSGKFPAKPGRYGHLGMYDREFIVTSFAQFEYIHEDGSNTKIRHRTLRVRCASR